MVLLNTALCLPALEIEVLAQGLSVIAAPKRFIVPGKRFALLPVQALPDDLTEEKIYHESAVKTFGAPMPSTKEIPTVQLWGKCEFCQHLTSQEKVQALSQLTIWKVDALAEHLRNQDNLFLAFIRLYQLSSPVRLDTLSTYQSPEHINSLIPLAQYLDVDETKPVLEEDKFLALKQKLIDLKVEPEPAPLNKIDDGSTAETDLKIVEEDLSRDIINDPEWFLKIAEIGNSSDGFAFEKLVRKSFIELGFQNFRKDAKASLDPIATGGAGGLDFYADKPYPIVGECKATRTQKVPSGTPAQLIRLGHSILQEHYNECIKMIFVAGDLTPDAIQTAENNAISVIRPETLQKLVELKKAYPGSIDLFALQVVLSVGPFGEQSDLRVNEFITGVWQCLTVRSLLVEAVRQLSIQNKTSSVPVGYVRVYYNAVCAKDSIPRLKDEASTRDLLIELSSPLTAYIGRDNSNDNIEQFYFLRELKIED
ncbi:MAG: DUF1802 family protein [Phormidesmis sp.]